MRYAASRATRETNSASKFELCTMADHLYRMLPNAGVTTEDNINVLGNLRLRLAAECSYGPQNSENHHQFSQGAPQFVAATAHVVIC